MCVCDLVVVESWMWGVVVEGDGDEGLRPSEGGGGGE